MSAGDAVQIGTEWLIGFGSASYTGYMTESIQQKFTAKQDEIPDERGATQSRILTNPGKSLKGTWLIKSTGGSLTPPAPGEIVTMTPPTGTSTKYLCVDADVKTSRLIAQLSMDLIREDSMAATYDA